MQLAKCLPIAHHAAMHATNSQTRTPTVRAIPKMHTGRCRPATKMLAAFVPKRTTKGAACGNLQSRHVLFPTWRLDRGNNPGGQDRGTGRIQLTPVRHRRPSTEQ